MKARKELAGEVVMAAGVEVVEELEWGEVLIAAGVLVRARVDGFCGRLAGAGACERAVGPKLSLWVEELGVGRERGGKRLTLVNLGGGVHAWGMEKTDSREMQCG